MSTKKIKIAVFGTTLFTKSDLCHNLEEKFHVFFCKNENQILEIIKRELISVLLLEIGPNGKELKILKQLQDQFPKLHVITLGLEKPQQHLINAFKYGSNDFFKIPLNVDLLIERINWIVRRNNFHN